MPLTQDAPPPDGPSPARLVAIPRLAAGGRWRIEAMRSLAEPFLLWVTRGQGRITVAGTTRGYGAFNAVFVPPGIMHGFEITAQAFGTAVFFGRGTRAVLPETPQHLRVREVASQTEMALLLDALQRESDSTRPGAARAAAAHLALVGVWLERQVAAAAADTPRPDAARRLAARFTALVEQEFRSGKGVGAYAEGLGVTATHLTRVCRAASGRPASDLLQERVVFEARRLLAETALPVAEISRSLGFTSPAYFTRAFQRRTGQTPSAFRRSG